MKDERLKKYFDPTIVGPGVWFVFHQMSLFAENNQVSLSFVEDFIKLLCLRFPCLDCRGHMRNMFNIHNFDFRGPSGLFNYSYMIHDKVNKRLGKTSPHFEYIRQIYEYGENENSPYRILDSIGPGVWWVLHATAQFSPDMLDMIITILRSSKIFDPWVCHFDILFFENAKDTVPGSQKPYFIWSFHNKINKLMGKPELPFGPVYDFFKNDSGCDDCGNNSGGSNKHLLHVNRPIHILPL